MFKLLNAKNATKVGSLWFSVFISVFIFLTIQIFAIFLSLWCKITYTLLHAGAESSKRSTRVGSSAGVDPRGIFPNHCMICSKHRIKVSGRFQVPSKVVTKTAEETLKKAAKARNDEKMLNTISGIDLIAQEFSKHEKCYLDYTRITRQNLETTTNWSVAMNVAFCCSLQSDLKSSS